MFSLSPSALSSEAASVAAGAVYVTPSKSDSPSSVLLPTLTGADIPTAESYAKNFVALMKIEEASAPLLHGYMEKQPQIDADTRCCIVDWMAGILVERRSHSSCLFLAVSILDRYLCVRAIASRKVKLAALGALWIAHKYVDGVDISAAEWTSPYCKDFESRRLLEMEADMCKVLGFRISHVTTDCFLSKFSCIPTKEEHVMDLAMFVAEVSLLDYHLLLYAPSELAAASLYVALCATEGPDAWTEGVTASTGYSPAELAVLVRRLERIHGAVSASGIGQYIRRKYGSHRYHNVAQIDLKKST